MSERWIFLDLDGTLLDVSPRYHQLHQDLAERFGGWPLPLSAYWEAKRHLVPEAEILTRAGLTAKAVQRALIEWRESIESPQYLELDAIWPWLPDVMERLDSWGRLGLVTLRQYPDRLERQVRRLGLSLYTGHVLSGRGDGTPQAKAPLLRNSGLCWSLDSVLIGDTEVDVASGRAAGLRTVAVSCGIRVPALLASWSPDALFDDLRPVPDWLAKG